MRTTWVLLFFAALLALSRGAASCENCSPAEAQPYDEDVYELLGGDESDESTSELDDAESLGTEDFSSKKGFAGTTIDMSKIDTDQSKFRAFGPESARQISGYLPVDRSGGSIWFWQFGPRSGSQAAPVVLWLAGGPGCTGLIPLFYENGPYKLDTNGNVKSNPYSWNKLATVIFVDQPVGTGLSYKTGGENVRTEEQVAEDLYIFMQNLYKLQPQLRSRPLHVFAESYGGHYAPAFAKYIVTKNAEGKSAQRIPLASVSIGNGLVNAYTQGSMYEKFALANGLISKPVPNYHSTLTACKKAISAGKSGNQLFGTCWELFAKVKEASSRDFNHYDVRKLCPESQPLCYDFSGLPKLIAKTNTASSLQLPASAVQNFHICNSQVYAKLEGDFFSYNGEADVATVLDRSNVKVLVYSGKEDFICNYFGGYKWINEMSWAHAALFRAKSLHSWQGAGQAKSQGNLTWLQIDGAGHMVPMDKPEVALKMLETVLKGESF